VKEAHPDKDGDQEDDKSSMTGDDDDTSYEELFAAVVTAGDGERSISNMFKVLPSRKVCQMWRRDLTFSYSVHVFFV
jgi:hypothetical protein